MGWRDAISDETPAGLRRRVLWLHAVLAPRSCICPGCLQRLPEAE